MDLNLHVQISAAFGGYVVLCAEPFDNDEGTGVDLVPYVCTDIDSLLRRVKATIENIDKASAEALKKNGD
jgi:hypothetical protein